MTGRPADMLCLGLVVLTNPVLYFFNHSPYYVPPDSVAYATLGRRFFSDFLFYLPSWGHVDSGLILPPLYPLLIALGAPFTENLLNLAEWISSASLLLAGIPLYLLVRRRAGRVVARIHTPDGADLSTALVTAGLGRPYAGGRRRSWCPG